MQGANLTLQPPFMWGDCIIEERDAAPSPQSCTRIVGEIMQEFACIKEQSLKARASTGRQLMTY